MAPSADTTRTRSALIPGRKRGVGYAKEVLWMGVDTVFEVLASQEGEIDGRQGFWPPGADTMRTRLALIPGQKRGVGCAKEVLWME